MKEFDELNESTLKAFMKGDNTAYEKVYDAYYLYIYKLAFQFFKNQEDAKDIVQEVFIKVYKYRTKLKTPEALSTWLYRICYTTCNDVYRKRKNMANEFDEMSKDEEIYTVVKETDIIQVLHLKDVKGVIIEALEELKPEYRTVAYLRFFEELKHQEIADITGIPLTSIGTYIKRSKQQIIKKLEHQGYPESSCLHAISTPFLLPFYKELGNSMGGVAAYDKVHIKKVVNSKIHIGRFASYHLAYMAIGICAVALPLVAALDLPTRVKNIIPKEVASITNVSYNQELSNIPIKIHVETSNDNYDQILINDSNTLAIRKNGEYQVKILKNGTLVDSQQVVITNIDRDIPIVLNEHYDGNQVILTLSDEDSGIDYKHIELLEGGKAIPITTINEVLGSITIRRNLDVEYILKIPDFAGNVANITIQFY